MTRFFFSFPFRYVQTIPFLFVLMTRKTQAIYTHLFQTIEKDVVQLRPESFMTDFEIAMRNGLRIVYPTAQLFSCWFHFCQAVKRHASQINGIMAAVHDSPEKAKIYYHLLCLPLLPADKIIAAFNEIKLEAKVKFGSTFDEFVEYYEYQWIQSVSVPWFWFIYFDRTHIVHFITFKFVCHLYLIRKGRRRFPSSSAIHEQHRRWRRIIGH